MKTAQRWGCFVLVAGIACGSTPDATPKKTASATSSATAAQSAAPAPSASASAPVADPCVEARKTVVTEADKIAPCKVDADCIVHPTVLCDFPELDCYAAHVNKERSTADFDQAVDAYKKSCPISKCKCTVPAKSVCLNNECAQPAP